MTTTSIPLKQGLKHIEWYFFSVMWSKNQNNIFRNQGGTRDEKDSIDKHFNLRIDRDL